MEIEAIYESLMKVKRHGGDRNRTESVERVKKIKP